MMAEIKPIAELVGLARIPARRGVRDLAGQAAARARGQRQEGRGPPRDHPHPLRARSRQDGPGRAQGLRPGGQALPGDLPPRRRVRAHAWRRTSRAMSSARADDGWSSPAGAPSTAISPSASAATTTPAATSYCKLEQGERSRPARSSSCARRPTAAALQRRLLARRHGDRGQGDRGRRAARGDEGLRHRHARHARRHHRVLIGREYIEREEPFSRGHREGDPGDPAAERHLLVELTGNWEKRLGSIERGADGHDAFMSDIAKFTTETVEELDKLKGVRIERAKLGPVRSAAARSRRTARATRAGRARSGMRDGDLEAQGRQVAAGVRGRELLESLRASRESGEDPAWGAPRQSRSPARSRAGRTFRAKLRLEQDAEGKWRVSSTRTGPRSRPRASPRRSVPRPSPDRRGARRR